jgi:hypothetical protein
VDDTAPATRHAFTMSDKATTIKRVRRCAAAAGIAAVALIATAQPAAAVLANAKRGTPADTEGARCPGAYYCIAPGPDPEVPYGTNPYVPYGADLPRAFAKFSDPGHPASEFGTD